MYKVQNPSMPVRVDNLQADVEKRMRHHLKEQVRFFLAPTSTSLSSITISLAKDQVLGPACLPAYMPTSFILLKRERSVLLRLYSNTPPPSSDSFNQFLTSASYLRRPP